MQSERRALSQKTEVFEPYCNLQYHGFRVYNACCLPAAQQRIMTERPDEQRLLAQYLAEVRKKLLLTPAQAMALGEQKKCRREGPATADQWQLRHTGGRHGACRAHAHRRPGTHCAGGRQRTLRRDNREEICRRRPRPKKTG